MHKIYSLLVLAACTAPRTSVTQQALGGTYTELHDLTYTEGNAVRGALVEYNGRLYGLAGEKGPNASGDDSNSCSSSANWSLPAHLYECPGSIFSLALDGSDAQAEYGFTQLNPTTKRNSDGYHPRGTLLLHEGVFYGTTAEGGNPTGTQGWGVLFAYDPDSSSFAVLHTFCSVSGCADGRTPMGALAVAANGDIVGTATAGGSTTNGTVFRYTPSTSAFAYAALPTGAGKAAYGGVFIDTNNLGHLQTFYGGANGYNKGAYSTVDVSMLTISPVADFPNYTPSSGGIDNTPISAPVQLSNGAIVAVREFGGAYGSGIIVKLNPTSGITTLMEFEGISINSTPRFSNTTGAMPNGTLAEGPDGMLYGSSIYGGANGAGNIFRVARDGSLFQSLYEWNTTDPGRSYGGPILASDGAYYGVTWNQSTIYKYATPTVWVCQ